MFGQPPFFKNDPLQSPLLPYLCSNTLDGAEIFFKNHDSTKRLNSQGRISFGFKKLLIKLLAFIPEERPSLSEVIEHDEWLAKGPNSQMLTQE